MTSKLREIKTTDRCVCFYRTDSLVTKLADIYSGDIILYLEQSRKKPFTHKIVFQDQVGWIFAYPENFEDVTGDHHAEPKEQA